MNRSLNEDEQTIRKNEKAFDRNELETIRDRQPISAPGIFELIRRQGYDELARPLIALAASGLIAGIALGFSVLTEGLMRAHLPDAPWRPLVENLGYTMGFLIVILGRMQLFTENTITAVCPVLDQPGREILRRLLRLWGIVLACNIVGATAFGLVLDLTRPMQPDLWEAIRSLSHHATDYPPAEVFLRGIGAGWLIAALVWVLPNATGNKPLMVILFTWLIALADFTHVIAGTTEAAFLVFAGEMSAGAAAFGYVLPAFGGNVLGGTVLFTVLAWAQIRVELNEANGRGPARRRKP